MKSVLICPGDRPAVSLLAAESPLCLVPAFGQSLVEYWMSHLAANGAKEVLVLASDRPDEVTKRVGDGKRWGLSAEIIAEKHELSPEEASRKYAAPAILMEHFPGAPEHPLFGSYQNWFEALGAWMGRAKTADRVGARELGGGIWLGLHGNISREARISGPCWIGDHVYVGPGAVIGPGAVLEDGAFVEREAEVAGSVVGEATFVGRYVQVINAIALGDMLIHWQTGDANRVTDGFLLCSVRLRHPGAKRSSLIEGLAEWFGRFRDAKPLDYEAMSLKEEACPQLVPVRQTR